MPFRTSWGEYLYLIEYGDCITNDGINENGVLASVHVVLADGIDDMNGTNEGGEVIDGRYVVRYILDHAKSAGHAADGLNIHSSRVDFLREAAIQQGDWISFSNLSLR